ncbi:MAG: hypothetical protein HDT43_11015 [Ruminococcaceae bacterium]|nr:hypothetical protein [Oscillospiraceae bacterium]
MDIWEQLYNAYCEGLLSVKPPEPSAHENYKIDELEKKFEMTDEQVQYFENIIFELSIDAEKRLFKAGFKTALRMLSE